MAKTKRGRKYMIFGKYINKYYLKNAPILILGLAALILSLIHISEPTRPY